MVELNQPIWKLQKSKWLHLPQVGVKTYKMKPPPPRTNRVHSGPLRVKSRIKPTFSYPFIPFQYPKFVPPGTYYWVIEGIFGNKLACLHFMVGYLGRNGWGTLPQLPTCSLWLYKSSIEQSKYCSTLSRKPEECFLTQRKLNQQHKIVRISDIVM